MNPIEKLHKSGQSIWYDNIERRLLLNGEMEKMISNGDIRGVTSNPSIFQNAISKSSDYDSAIQPMAWSDWSSEDIFFQLAIEDIQTTADLFSLLYENSNGGDGYVSLEVNPKLAYDTEGTFLQAKELWKKVNRKNLMIKIPATKEGLPAIRKSIAAGININVTLIFSVERYEEVIDAYLSGLEDRIAQGQEINNIASVASFFVSRVDSKIDSLLELKVKSGEIDPNQYFELRGNAAINNSRLAYELFEKKFSENRFKKLNQHGARVQRPLWASTSTKNPDYSDVLYVEELIGENTVNTVPPQTLDAFKDHGQVEQKIRKDLDKAKNLFEKLNSIGINIDDVTQLLEDEGVSAFAKAFEALLNSINERKLTFIKQLNGLSENLQKRIEINERQALITRIFEKDSSIWSSDKNKTLEIQNRLGWLDSPYVAKSLMDEIIKLRDELVDNGFTHALLLGMGGSSLAAEVLSLSFRGIADGLNLSILDSTDPRQVKFSLENNPSGKTIFIVSSKSGGTTEVQAFLSYFYNQMREFAGDQAGKYFIAITDPDTELARQAKDLNFRKIIYADPTVGGRFSALTAFGLVPAALMGIELVTFLSKTKEFINFCRPGIPSGRNPGLVLGSILAEAAMMGKDKLTIIAEEPFRSFGSWLEQLVAESSGKNGKGIIPIDIEPFVPIQHYSDDRLIIYLKNDGIFEENIHTLLTAGHPVITYKINDPYDIGAEFYRWELAIAVTCAILQINTFDQPDVQDNKNRTKQKVTDFKNLKKFDFGKPYFSNDQFDVYSSVELSTQNSENILHIIDSFLDHQMKGDYIAINAYLPKLVKIEKQLQDFRRSLLIKTGKATTLGFGPRFLHSTGQLHKGGPDKGLFIQIIDESNIDFDIPGMGITFKILLTAQALGDYEALLSRGKKIILIHLKKAEISDLW